MIRMPDFVTDEVFGETKKEALKKKDKRNQQNLLRNIS
jgi:hypothetical protein